MISLIIHIHKHIMYNIYMIYRIIIIIDINGLYIDTKYLEIHMDIYHIINRHLCIEDYIIDFIINND